MQRRGRGGKKVNYARRRWLALAAVSVLCAALVVFILGSALTWGDGIRSGVSIGEVDVGGKTPQEARAALDRYASDNFKEISFTGTDLTVTGEDLGVKMDTKSSVDRAYAVGREGWFGRRISETLQARLGGYQVKSELSYDKKAAQSAIDKVAARFHEEPKNATFRVADDGKIEIQKAQDGRVLDREQTLANLDRALSDLRDRVPVAESAAPKPDVTTQEVQNLAPKEKIGEYQTDFRWDSNPNRKSNMRLAAGSVNNTLLKPGETFSFNDHAAELDYKEAKTFSDGGVGFANGGGLCQVSSTLYMAAQYAGLEIVERHPHYAVLPYIKPGFDATVWFGDQYGYGVQDMKFKNTTDGYILIREFVDDKGYLTAEIYGRPTGLKVEMRTEKIFESTARGIRWTTYKKVTNENGEVIRNGFLHTYLYSYNPPVPEGIPHYDTSAPRVSGWNDPGNTTGWAEVPQ